MIDPKRIALIGMPGLNAYDIASVVRTLKDNKNVASAFAHALIARDPNISNAQLKLFLGACGFDGNDEWDTILAAGIVAATRAQK